MEEQESQREKPQVTTEDRFTQFMFGTRGNKQVQEPGKNSNNQVTNNINVDELMQNIDTLMTSASKLKPLLKKVSPVIQQFINKK